ncbi:hypothetical protein [Psychrobacillus vulpis]|uniref:hypothetical protein n=1 Tax=Psychrobacillus vulpis TaxID=2325572 RepID=UPI001408116C|nr:hypothetical protein [Psychrobacillus vulpis]
MIKSVKGQFILGIVTAILFVCSTFNYIEFSGEKKFPQVLFYFAMIFSVYNAGSITQKYIQTKREANS